MSSAVGVLRLSLTVRWVGLQCVFVEFSKHTDYFFISPFIVIETVSQRKKTDQQIKKEAVDSWANRDTKETGKYK